MEPTLHSFIYTYIYPIFTAYTFALRYWNRTGRCQSTPSAAPERPRYKFSQQKRKTTTQKNARKKEGEREKVFVFLLSVLFRRTKIIKLALCKTRQKLFKLDNCAAGTVVVVRHCCSSTDRKKSVASWRQQRRRRHHKQLHCYQPHPHLVRPTPTPRQCLQ